MHTAVLTLFKTNCYTFGGKFYFQMQGGPIGLRLTCCIARMVMMLWDKQFLEKMSRSNITLEEKQRYMDDIRLWCYSIRLGWRWNAGELVFLRSWKHKEEDKRRSGAVKRIEVIRDMMNKLTIKF